MKRLKKRFIVACKQINRGNTNPGNAKEHYQSFIRKKNKISKTIRNNYLSVKNVWTPKSYSYKIIYYRTSKHFT